MTTPHGASRRSGAAGTPLGAGAAPASQSAQTGRAASGRGETATPGATGGADDGQTDTGETAQAPRRQRPARPMFGTTVLWGEVFVVFFALLVANGLRVADPTVLGILGAVGMVACAVAARLQRTRAGIVVGSAVQLLLILGGFLVPTMFVVGAVFSIIWVLGVWLGLRIDRERAERETSTTTPDSATEGNG